MVFSSQLVKGVKASSGSPLRYLNTGIQRCLTSHPLSHCCSRSRERFPRSPVSHLPTTCRCLGGLKASWMALGIHVWAAEPAPGRQTAEQGWLWGSRRIQLHEDRFLVLLYKPWSPHGGDAQTLKVLCDSCWPPSGGHCALADLYGNSFLQATEPSISPSRKEGLDTQRSGRLLRTDTHVQVPSSGVESQSWFSTGKVYCVFPNSNAFGLLLRLSQMGVGHKRFCKELRLPIAGHLVTHC